MRLEHELRYATGAWRRLRLSLLRLDMKRIEGRMAKKSPHLVFASVRDREAVVGRDGDGAIIPQAVDLAHWTRRTYEPEPNAIVFTGVMNYRPNHDAAMFLATEILPLVREEVPEARVYIVGRSPLPELIDAVRDDPSVIVAGRPADMRTYFERATIACAPLRFASGMQFKVLEALAMEVPMVTMPAAADGLRIDGAEPPLLVGENAQELADGLVSLLRDADERSRLAAEGRSFIENHFTWQRSSSKLEAMLLEAAGQRSESGEAAYAG